MKQQIERPLEGKTALVIGMERSGRAAAALLVKLGAKALLYDRKTKDLLPSTNEYMPDIPENMAEWHAGENVETLCEKADFAVYSPGIPLDAPDLEKVRKKGVQLYGEMEFASRHVPCPLYAVTGTNGKTTTVSLLADMLDAAGRLTFAAGNIGFPLSAAALGVKENDSIVLEVSSFQLESADTFHPRAAAVLNVTPDHLNRHGTMEKYVALKASTFKNMAENDLAVLNFEDAHCRRMAEDVRARVAWFSSKRRVENGACVRDGMVVLTEKGREREICRTDEIFIKGAHNLENALAAVLLADFAGVPAPVIRHSLRRFKGVEHRTERVRTLNGVTYINDSKGTNPESTQRAVEALDKPAVMILGGSDKHTPFDQLARVMKMSRLVRHAVVMGQTADTIARALEDAGFTEITKAENLTQAVAIATELCENNGVVLFSPACASFDMFKDYEERGRIFKKIVNNL